MKAAIDIDHRQTVYVFLVSHGRQKYFTFHCNYCGTKVCHLEADKIYSLADVNDSSFQSDKQKIKIRCNGPYCRTWYEFVLNT